MTKLYRVEWALPAEEDLREIINYIAQDSVANALKIARKLE